MTYNNPIDIIIIYNIDIFNVNSYIKFCENLSIYSQDIERKRNFGANQGPKLWYKCVEKTCTNPNLDLVNMNAYIRFGENLSICSQDIERKQNFGVNHGPLLWYKYAKITCNNPSLDLVIMNADINLVKICQFVLKVLSGNEFLA